MAGAVYSGSLRHVSVQLKRSFASTVDCRLLSSFWCKLGYLTPALVRVWPGYSGYTVVNVPTGNYVTINAFGGHTELSRLGRASKGDARYEYLNLTITQQHNFKQPNIKVHYAN